MKILFIFWQNRLS